MWRVHQIQHWNTRVSHAAHIPRAVLLDKFNHTLPRRQASVDIRVTEHNKIYRHMAVFITYIYIYARMQDTLFRIQLMDFSSIEKEEEEEEESE